MVGRKGRTANWRPIGGSREESRFPVSTPPRFLFTLLILSRHSEVLLRIKGRIDQEKRGETDPGKATFQHPGSFESLGEEELGGFGVELGVAGKMVD